MPVHKWSEIKNKMAPERQERLRAETDKLLTEIENKVTVCSLRELREMVGKTQAEVGSSLGMTQSQVSKLERRKDHLLSTIRRYVEALGGELQVSVIIEGKRITLVGGQKLHRE